MKKLLYFILIIPILIFLVSCSSEDEYSETFDVKNISLKYDNSVTVTFAKSSDVEVHKVLITSSTTPSVDDGDTLTITEDAKTSEIVFTINPSTKFLDLEINANAIHFIMDSIQIKNLSLHASASNAVFISKSNINDISINIDIINNLRIHRNTINSLDINMISFVYNAITSNTTSSTNLSWYKGSVNFHLNTFDEANIKSDIGAFYSNLSTDIGYKIKIEAPYNEVYLDSYEEDGYIISGDGDHILNITLGYGETKLWT